MQYGSGYYIRRKLSNFSLLFKELGLSLNDWTLRQYFIPFLNPETGNSPLETYLDNGACAVGVLMSGLSTIAHVVMINGHEGKNWICKDSAQGKLVKIPKRPCGRNTGEGLYTVQTMHIEMFILKLHLQIEI